MLKTTLNHLPERKQANIKAIVDITHSEFDTVVARATSTAKTQSRILLIALFGSYAKGNYVDDPKNGYVSDYDIVVVLNEPALTDDYTIWHTVEERAMVKVGAPVNIIVCTLQEINRELQQGHYFFKDIREQGIQLYNYNNTELLTPGVLNAAEAKKIAQQHFDQWYKSADAFFKQYQYAINDKEFKIAAFQLHQTVERYLSCLLLVHTNYRPKTHNIKALHSLATQQAAALADIFPQDAKFKRRSFQLLKKAYIEARYSEHYAITAEELTWLAEHTQQLQRVVSSVCQEKITAL